MMVRKGFLSVLLIVVSILVHSQPANRIADYNSTGWFMYFGDHKITAKWGVHSEYQWRRNDLIKTWQQSLLRIGINRNIDENVMVTLGYGHIQTFPYGDDPIASTGYAFPEHRIYQQLLIRNPVGRMDISHRFRIEQRWLAKLRTGSGPEIFGWNYVNRVRYLFRIAFPLQGNTIEDKEFFIAGYDEVFIGFGKRVGYNVFDQNRIYLALGYKINSSARIEAGYLLQIVQHGRLHTGTSKPVFEYNNALQIGLTYNVDFTKP